MARAKKTSSRPGSLHAMLRDLALELSQVAEGLACAGTALETLTVKTGGKAFLFLRRQDVRLKLGASLVEARRVATTEPKACKVGASGWVWVALEAPPVAPSVLAKWVRESHGLFVTR